MLMPSIFGERLFDEFMDDFAMPERSWNLARTSANVMKTDVKETEQGYELDIDLPGYNKEDINAKLENGYLTINAVKDSNKDTKDENGKYIRRERYYGSMSRSFYVGEHVTEEDIHARFENGILKLSLPKEELQKVEAKKYIAIEG